MFALLNSSSKCLLTAQHLSSDERDGVSSSSATCSIFRSFRNPTTRQHPHQLSCKYEHYSYERFSWFAFGLNARFSFFYPHVNQKNKTKTRGYYYKTRAELNMRVSLSLALLYDISNCVWLCCHHTEISNCDTMPWKISMIIIPQEKKCTQH